MILAECYLIVSNLSDKKIPDIECSDFSCPYNHMHSENCEDDIMSDGIKVDSNKIHFSFEVVLELSFRINDCCFINIWQPPKFS